MSRQARIRSASDIYHIIIRGNGKRTLFETQGDGKCFLSLLKKYSQKDNVKVYGYCMMNNHVHLLLRAELPVIANFMKRLEGTYALIFNRKYQRTGSLYEGRFVSIPVHDERQLLTVLQYIHMNPERAGICKMEAYAWSSYQEYFGKNSFCDTIFVKMIAGE